MATMTPCTECQQHYFRSETACPHCGAAAPTRVRGFVRQARMGGLMLFTALTTTACYGTPAMIDNPNGVTRPGVEVPLKQMPKNLNTAFVYLASNGRTLTLSQTRVVGDTLTLKTADGSFSLVLQVPDATLLGAGAGLKEALPVEEMKALTVHYADGAGSLDISSPGAAGLQGTFQVGRAEDVLLGGVLRLEQNGRVLEVYFLAAR